MKTNQKEKPVFDDDIVIKETFKPFELKSLDSKNRITLNNKLIKSFRKKMDIDAYRILVSDNGDILLRPNVSVPSNEAWVFTNPEANKRIRKGLEESKAGKIERVKNVDSFLKDL